MLTEKNGFASRITHLMNPLIRRNEVKDTEDGECFSGKVLQSEMSDLYSAPRHIVWTLFIRSHTHTQSSQQLQPCKHTHTPRRATTVSGSSIYNEPRDATVGSWELEL